MGGKSGIPKSALAFDVDCSGPMGAASTLTDACRSAAAIEVGAGGAGDGARGAGAGAGGGGPGATALGAAPADASPDGAVVPESDEATPTAVPTVLGGVAGAAGFGWDTGP